MARVTVARFVRDKRSVPSERTPNTYCTPATTGSRNPRVFIE
jgi:hypothetical protein